MARKQRWKVHGLLDAPDTIIHVGTRYRGDVIVGGQTGGSDADDLFWANENYPGSVHQDLPYWGFWAGRGTQFSRIAAGDLRLDGMSLEGGDDGVARIAAATATVLRWNVRYADRSASWEVLVKNATTGATAHSGAVLAASGEGDEISLAVPSLTAGSYLARVRVSSTAREYPGLPSDYVTVSGQGSRTPAAYRWLHPTLGAVYYDPIWNVGALPYDTGAADQAALLAARAAAVAAGTARKHPAWTNELYAFNGDGTPFAFSGEWSMLRVVAGAGAWIGDDAAHAGATAGAARWMAGETLDFVPVMLDPRARSVGAFYQEEIEGADVLWEGALIGGRHGRTVALYKHVDGILETSYLGHTSAFAVRICECAESTEHVTSIARDPFSGILYVTTYCDRFALDEATGELIPAHPGGRSLVVARDAAAKALLAYTTESDFANSKLHARGFNYILSRDAQGWNLGPGTAHHIPAALVAHAGAVYAIEEVGDASGFFGPKLAAADRRQFLSRFTGGKWQRVTGALSQGWSCAERDLGPGARSRGGVNFFGEDELGNPTAIRYQGTNLEKNISGVYHPRNPQTVLSADGKGENVLTPARKRNEDGSLADGWYLVETTGLAATLLFTYDPECGGSGCFCIPLSALVEAGVDASELPHCLQWTGDCWQAGACSGNYLELVIDSEGGTACYHVHGTLPYDPSLFDGLEWMDGRACVLPVAAVANAREALERMPEGTVAHSHRVRVEPGGVISAVKIEGTLNEAEIQDDYPLWCWIGGAPLPSERGDPISEGMDAALETFTTRAKLGQIVWLELPRTDVFVCYLIPPGKKIAADSKAIF